ncbi:MAG: RNA polymerase sigma factor [Spirochaetaceae bacterium]
MTRGISEEMLTDEELALEFARKGSEAAFQELARRMQPTTRRLFMSLFCGSVADVEDAEQETLLALLDALRRFSGRSTLKTFWFRVAHNTGITLLRKKGRQRRLGARLSELSAIEAQEDPGTLVAEKAAADRYLALIDALPPKDRSILHLFYVEELPVREVARALGMKEGTVKSRLHRLRKRLQRTKEAEDE